MTHHVAVRFVIVKHGAALGEVADRVCRLARQEFTPDACVFEQRLRCYAHDHVACRV